MSIGGQYDSSGKEGYLTELRVLNRGKQTGNISKSCRYFGISRETFYKWKGAHENEGVKGLINSKPCPRIPRSGFRNIPRIRFSTCVGPIILASGVLHGICKDITKYRFLRVMFGE